MYQAIVQVGGKRVRYTEYPGVAHNAWDPAWEEPTLEWWLLAQRKGLDHAAPDTVDNLQYELVNGTRVKVTWSPPADSTRPDNRVWFYRVYRDTRLMAELDDGETSYIDPVPVSSTSHSYAISTVNFFFEESALSSPIVVKAGS
jgi:hypothetical protein